MNIQELCKELNLTPVAGESGMDKEISGCYIGDLMSLAMAHLEEGYVWITIQSNLNVVAVSALKEAACVILADGVTLDANATVKADEEALAVFTTEDSAYTLAKKLGALGI
ncbi:MAG: hypothetical protein IJB80_00345 [Clostridia bacterium]|nr:hypothetical protein [Clostridia bacterium]